MSDEKEKEPKRELKDIRPDKVSLVDLGANNEMFFIAKGLKVKKSEDGEPTEFAKAVTSYLQGISMRVTTLSEWLKSAETDDNGSIPQQVTSLLKRTRDSIVDVKMALDGETSLGDVKVSGEVRDKMVSMLDVVAEKVIAASEGISKSETDEASEDFMKALDQIVVALSSIVEYQELAIWTTAYINDLPDSAFLYIVPDGEKDGEGKTTPRTNRKFPYKDKDGKVDLPHLRNAIARIPQSSLSQDLKDSLQAKARKILAANTETEKNEDLEETMSEKIATLIKSVGDAELDVEYIKKQVGSATALLNNLMSTLNIDEEEAKKMDFWDLRYKIGEAVGLLVDAAKLEGILNTQVTKTEEDTMTEKKVEEKSAEEKTIKSSDSSTEAETKSKEEEKETQKEAESKVDLMKSVMKAVQEAIKPISEKVEALIKKVEEQETEVEKMANDRAVAKGGNPDETHGNIEKRVETKSNFTGIMPDHLRGTYRHGEKVED